MERKELVLCENAAKVNENLLFLWKLFKYQ